MLKYHNFRYRVLHKSFEVEMFCGFCGLISKHNLFSELVIMPLSNTQDYYATANVFQQITVHFFNCELFHLKQFAIHSSYTEHTVTLCIFVILKVKVRKFIMIKNAVNVKQYTIPPIFLVSS